MSHPIDFISTETAPIMGLNTFVLLPHKLQWHGRVQAALRGDHRQAISSQQTPGAGRVYMGLAA